MNYLKVKPESHDININSNGWKLVANELFTKSELKRLGASDKLISNHLENISLSSHKTYRMFGARFAVKN